MALLGRVGCSVSAVTKLGLCSQVSCSCCATSAQRVTLSVLLPLLLLYGPRWRARLT